VTSTVAAVEPPVKELEMMSDDDQTNPSQQQQAGSDYRYEQLVDRTHEIEQHLFEGRRVKTGAARGRDSHASQPGAQTPDRSQIGE
jgi:hypothetical protein